MDADEYETCHAMADAALAVVAQWLHELAAEQWQRATSAPTREWQERAAMRAMYLTERAIELEGGQHEPSDPAALSRLDPA